jgi:hypothetical protein
MLETQVSMMLRGCALNRDHHRAEERAKIRGSPLCKVNPDGTYRKTIRIRITAHPDE